MEVRRRVVETVRAEDTSKQLEDKPVKNALVEEGHRVSVCTVHSFCKFVT